MIFVIGLLVMICAWFWNANIPVFGWATGPLWMLYAGGALALCSLVIWCARNLP